MMQNQKKKKKKEKKKQSCLVWQNKSVFDLQDLNKLP